MSNALAIAATTNTLRNLLLRGVRELDGELSDLEVTTRTPDVARKGVSSASLNLFLYQTVLNAGWRNLPMPGQVRAGEQATPPLALNLHYLLTAYGRSDADTDALSHRVLGGAMSVLHDHVLLGAEEIRNALLDNDLADQIERVRVSPLCLSTDDMFKLWSAFQTNYRVSAAYEATVILIDSRMPVKAALPVLRRGKDDRGAKAVGALGASLAQARPMPPQPAARLGESVALAGANLQTADAKARFTSLIASTPGEVLAPPRVLLPVQAGPIAGELAVQLATRAQDPDALERWAPGFYTVALVVEAPGTPSVVSNEAAFALAPIVSMTPNSASLPNALPGAEITLTCTPRVRDAQRGRVQVLFGDLPLVPTAIINPSPLSPTYKDTPTKITFDVPQVDPDLYLVRLRVDGVDSMPAIVDGASGLPGFDPAQQVRV